MSNKLFEMTSLIRAISQKVKNLDKSNLNLFLSEYSKDINLMNLKDLLENNISLESFGTII